jgi:hypothetical protein
VDAVIPLGTLPIHEPHTPREQRIEAAEDRAEQVAYEVAGERRHG